MDCVADKVHFIFCTPFSVRRLCMVFALVLALADFQRVGAQTPTESWQDYFDGLSEVEEAESESLAEQFEQLQQLSEQKINLNQATREDFEQLPFLSEHQIESLCYYIYRYGPVWSMGELALMDFLDYRERKLLEQFVYVGEPTRLSWLENVKKYGKSELVGTALVPFYERKGDDNGYLGYPYRHSVRYVFSRNHYLKAGIVGAQDAGEPFFANRNKAGYDHYSLFLLAERLGRLETLALGHYRLRFGKGLVMNNDFSFGKLMTLATLGRNYSQIRAHSSRTSWNYLQGVAATVRLSEPLRATMFASYREIDATLSTDGQSIATLLQTGYHRTVSEMNRKNNAAEFVGGANLSFRQQSFHAGLTAVCNQFDRQLAPNTAQLYRRYSPEGRHFWNVSADYGYQSDRLTLSGETATGNSGALATLNTLSFTLNSALSLMAVQRFYSYKYYALHANSFAEGGDVQNESGIFVGMNWKPGGRWSLMAYTDYVYFPWARYLAAASSHAWDNLLMATWQRGKFKLSARYRLRLKQRNPNSGDPADGLANQTEQRGRVVASVQGGLWTLKTQADVVNVHQQTSSTGYMLTQNVGFQKRNLSLNASVAYFHTDDYDSRLYAFERSMLYQFANSMFYGEGIRCTLWARATLPHNLCVTAKWGLTNYFDRSTIGSGLQQIDASSMSDLHLQLRWKF